MNPQYVATLEEVSKISTSNCEMKTGEASTCPLKDLEQFSGFRLLCRCSSAAQPSNNHNP